MRPRVQPEQLGIALDLGEHSRVDPVRIGEDFLEDVTHLEVGGIPLIVVDVATRQGRPVQVPDQDLLVERKGRKPVGVQLRNSGVVHSLQQIFAIRWRRVWRLRGRDGRRLGGIRERRVVVVSFEHPQKCHLSPGPCMLFSASLGQSFIVRGAACPP